VFSTEEFNWWDFLLYARAACVKANGNITCNVCVLHYLYPLLPSNLARLAAQGEAADVAPGEAGIGYVAALRQMAGEGQVPELVCHYYNHYFAHTARGRMLWKMISQQLPEGETLSFHQWPTVREEGHTEGRGPSAPASPPTSWTQFGTRLNG
jgi:hypothetical protein